MKRIAILILHFAFCILQFATAQVVSYVDPRIGSEGLGRTYIGPCVPFGMAKPGPDCGTGNNAGWTPMPALVSGFSQTHVSGTGGGPKYGNILIQPGLVPQHRSDETIELGYYATTYQETGIRTEITASRLYSSYRITFPDSVTPAFRFDLTHFLGRNPVPKAREAQQFERAEIYRVNDNAVAGSQTISGGWNNGGPYTVYFYAEFNSRIEEQAFHRGQSMDVQCQRNDVEMTVGISYISPQQAHANIERKGFNAVRQACIDEWEKLLSSFHIEDNSASSLFKTQFYTALYHTCLMPTTREDGTYDDYYAIWDTYRTSTPLLTLLDKQRATEIARSLLTIYQRDGYMPDARSGNSNGRTQGGSNGEIVMVDALAKGLDLDYALALEAMLKDATVPPEDDEAEGRGGLEEYNTLGYIPYGIARAGNRTVEYSFCDWAIAQVAQHLGKEDLYNKYMEQSRRWQNLWRANYEHDGARGFIMPRDHQGQWLDDLPFGHSKLQKYTFRYTPDTSYEGPWYCPWWDCFMYEASSWEYSFSIPHDILTLIQLCGGPEKFEARLDTFFSHNYYNVANEPSFLTPCLYHWIGKPERSSQRIHEIITQHFDTTSKGLPGNDDGGAMSSWLAFHILGLYPLAGTDQYLIHSPFIKEWTFGKLTCKADSTIETPLLNGVPLRDWRINHAQLLEGGMLLVPSLRFESHRTKVQEPSNIGSIAPEQYLITYKLHGQTRRFHVSFKEHKDSLTLFWSIERNLRLWTGSYTMTPKARRKATHLSYEQPLDGQHIVLPNNQLFALFPTKALKEIKKKGNVRYCNTNWVLTEQKDSLLHLIDTKEGGDMWVRDDIRLPLIVSMQNNPVEINWEAKEVRE
ncbi:MAG: GH92 family glycosyl hydrolase [Bacteroidaceae bacterium]|nr:GH92 family glycosyl hydrolase [Bacteroidaceae bacterium]